MRRAILPIVIGLLLTTVPGSVAGATQPRAGTVAGATPARGLAIVKGAATSTVLRYRMTSVTGKVVEATGLMLLPQTAPPRGGWPFVVYNHVTTGAADLCAPSTVTADNEVAEMMLRGDDIATRLLRHGVAVLRPDFEGIGGDGPHPYMIGRSLRASVVDMVTAARATEPRLGTDWIVSGHSEGSVGALWTAAKGARLPAGTHLRGVVALTPVTQIATELRALRAIPVAALGVNGLSALAALFIQGAISSDAGLRRLVHHGGLSQEAIDHLPDLEDRCLAGLGASDSWGGIAPADIPGQGATGDRAVEWLASIMDANDPDKITIRPGVAVRIDAGIRDAVAPLPFTEQLVQTYRDQGADVTYERWMGGHPEVPRNGYAAGPAVAWMLAHLARR